MAKDSRPWCVTLCISFCLLFTSLVPSAGARITIGIIGDQFGVRGRVGSAEFETHKAAAYRALADGVAALNRKGPMDTVLHVGDLTESTQADDVITTDFNRAARMMAALSSGSSPKWFLAPGDHDVNPVEWVQNSRDRSKETHFISLYRTINHRIGDRLYYSFDINGYHFVSLYSHDHLRSDPRWGNIYLARVSDSQLAWLKEDLAAAANSRGIIVFTHQPLWYNRSAWTPVHDVLAGYNTLAVIAGHYHYDQKDHVSDGIEYRVVGALGGHVKTAVAAYGGWWHVTRLTIGDDSSLTWQLIPVEGGKKEAFTSRWDMDRVQALNYALGDAARNLASQSIYIKDGRLVDADGNSPATLTLSGLGNPVDQVVTAAITLKADAGYTLTSGKYAAGICENGRDAESCRVIPGANIAYSNNSTVRPACARYTPDFSECLEHKPFWQGVITQKEGRIPEPGEPIPLTISLEFTSESSGRLMRIWQETAVQVKPFTD
ncbi:MAG: metallophosphoesterase [Desulfobacterales bacterium]|nr:metallophosphoesterase [Desulfobacterales bacterium]